MVGRLRLRGVHAVVYAMFDASEQLDHEAMVRQVEYCLEKGCHGITVLGLATEVLKLRFDERVSLIKTVSRAVASRVPLSVTVSGNSIAEQVELIGCAQDHNADWLILQPPMVGNYNAEVYLDFFDRVAAKTSLPFAIQNAPAYLGRSLSSADIEQVFVRNNALIAIKSEDTADGMKSMIDIAGDRFGVLGGRGGQDMIKLLQLGCQGFVLAPDIAPVGVKIFEHWQEGRYEAAKQLYEEASPAILFAMQSLEHLICYGKRMFAQACGLMVYDRAPCLSADQKNLYIARNFAGQLMMLAEGK